MSGDAAPGRPARLHPYTLVFLAGGFEPRLDDIRTEAQTRAADVSDPERLVMLGEAGRLLRELLPEDADPSAMLDVGRLIFHAYHFRETGRSTYALERAALDLLLADAQPESAGPSAPGAAPPVAAGYLQLPRHALWARVAEGAPWEAADGIFWATSSGASGGDYLHALVVLGIRPDRPGFSVVAVTADALPDEGDWARVRARPEGPDFANVLPGGELSGLHALLNGAEVLKLLARFFQYVAARPAAVQQEPAATGEAGAAAVSPERRFRVGAPDGR